MLRLRRSSWWSAVCVACASAAVAPAQGDAEFRRAEWRAWFERRFAEETARIRTELLREFEERSAAAAPAKDGESGSGRASAEARARIAALEAENAELRAKLRAFEAAPPRRSAATPRPPAPPSRGDAAAALDDASSPAERLRGLRGRIAALEARGVAAERLAPLKEAAEALAREIGVDAAPPEVQPEVASGGGARARFLGVYPGPVAPEWNRRRGTPEGVGVRVVDVVPDSPAAAAGLRRDDVLMTLDGEPVRGEADLRAKLAASRGASVRLAFRRGEAALEASAAFPTSSAGDRGVDPGREAEFRRVFDGAVRMAVGDEPVFSAPASRPAGGG